MPRPVVYPNVFGTLSGTVSASLLDQNFNADGAIINDSAAGWVNAAIDTGSVNSYVITLNPPASAYLNGFFLAFLPLNQNTGPSSINVNNLGNIQILKQDGSALTPQTIVPGTVYSLICINNAMRIIAPNSSVIVGEIQLFAGVTPPSNWLTCNGNAVSRNQYPALFGVISTTYGIGDGATTFNIPNFTGSFPTQTTTLGQTGGASTVQLTNNNLPTHLHGIADPGHLHSVFTDTNTIGVTGGASQILTFGPGTTGTSVTGINQTQLFGGGQAFAIVPPFVSVNFIIRAF
jgi:microcystin-dependent protein